MKRISLFTGTPSSLSANEMKHLKGGGSCGYLPIDTESMGPIKPTCGLSESQAMGWASASGGTWCCYDCKTRADALAKC